MGGSRDREAVLQGTSVHVVSGDRKTRSILDPSSLSLLSLHWEKFLNDGNQRVRTGTP